jgi:hypothetical protein
MQDEGRKEENVSSLKSRKYKQSNTCYSIVKTYKHFSGTKHR